MPFPKTKREFKEAGYKGINWSECRGCGVRILWVETPKGKKMPLNEPNEYGEYLPHWDSCPKAKDFRKEKER